MSRILQRAKPRLSQKSVRADKQHVQRLQDFADHLLQRYHVTRISDLPPGPLQDFQRALARVEKLADQAVMQDFRRPIDFDDYLEDRKTRSQSK